MIRKVLIGAIIIYLLFVAFYWFKNRKKGNLKGYAGLKKEIKQTCLWFADMDIHMYGYITDKTKQVFKVQKIAIPNEYKKFLK